MPGIPNGKRITLADLAGMQSGVANYTSVKAFIDVFARDLAQPFTDAQIVGYTIPASPRFEPGAEYDYSNTNTILLGMAIEKITGASFASVLQARILGPLGLTGTSYPTQVALPDRIRRRTRWTSPPARWKCCLRQSDLAVGGGRHGVHARRPADVGQGAGRRAG